MLRKFENENKKQNQKNLRLKIYGKIRNGGLKLEPSVLMLAAHGRILLKQSFVPLCLSKFLPCAVVNL